ncbi:TPA: hypothetical protein ACX6PG_002627 [Photobacterium damselae]
MFRRYRLEVQDLSQYLKDNVPPDRYIIIKDEIEEQEEKITCGLKDAYVDGFGYDANALQDSWFPIVKGAHVFISHSHADKEFATNLAIWLKHYFNLNAFIDSHIWGYALKLQKKIDDKHCKNADNQSYSYEKRNFSTSHVHLMLANSLTLMLDECECLIFLETSNSLLSVDNSSDLTDASITASPWIMHELSTSGMLRINGKIFRKDLKAGIESLSKDSSDIILQDKSPEFSAFYNLDLKKLPVITHEDLSTWSKDGKNGFNALTELYNIKGDTFIDGDEYK